jgi:two-component system, chemotaxis family, sensor kinase CheA
VAGVDPRWQQLRTAFSAELEERVRELNALLLALERGDANGEGRAATYDALFRQAHSLKGAARAVGLADVERLAHALESALGAARGEAAAPGPAWFDAVYQAVDALTPLYGAALAGSGTDGVDLPATLAALEAAPLAPPEERPAASTDEGGPEGPRPAPPEPADHLAAPLTAALSGPANEAPSVPPGGGPAASLIPRAPLERLEEPPPLAPRDRPAPAEAPAPSAESVRVAVDKLDALLAASGELTVAHLRLRQRLRDVLATRDELHRWRRQRRVQRRLRTRLQRALPLAEQIDRPGAQALGALLRFDERAERVTQALLERTEELAARLRDDTAQLGLVARAIEDEVLAVRLLPIATLYGPLERLVRDLARHEGKEVRLALEGGATEIDRKIIEQVRDPLMHMLRNAVDHGIEPPAVRAALGKPRGGTIRLAALQRGGTIEIVLEDDGSGMDPTRLRAAAVAKGLLSDAQASALADAAALDLIFRPGLSTSEVITETSGRGVGMDVVRTQLERLQGQVAVNSEPGRGTRFTLIVPLTLATTRALLVEQDGLVYAIPSSLVERSGRVREAELRWLEGRRAVAVDGQAVLVAALGSLLERPVSSHAADGPASWRPFVVLSQGERRVAVLVDALVGEQEIVIKPLAWPLRRVRNVSGAAVLGSGQLVVILNPMDLLRGGVKQAAGAPGAAGPPAPAAPGGGDRQARRRARLLVVDDSLTTRTLERSILEAAGYEVLLAGDGAEALDVLRREAVDLIVSDVDMPRLDGFALTSAIRRDEALRRLPVVLVTSLAAPEHRERGVAVGADAYLVKSGFDQAQLVDTVGRLL